MMSSKTLATVSFGSLEVSIPVDTFDVIERDLYLLRYYYVKRITGKTDCLMDEEMLA